MRVRPTRKSVCTVAAIAMAAAIAACSTTKATGPDNPGNVSKGDSVNLSGTYDLAAFTGATVDASDGATLVLGKTTYNITVYRLVQLHAGDRQRDVCRRRHRVGIRRRRRHDCPELIGQ